MGEPDVVVVGAGQAGVASALAVADVDLRPLVLEREAQVAAAWRERYDRLHLNTSRWLSHLPGRPYPKGTAMFPAREDVIAYLERHATENGIELRLGTTVDRLDRDDGHWVLATSRGEVRARQVIVATGYEREPRIPEWEGREDFRGRVLHASEYRNPRPFAGERVLVVGPGCSGMEIAYDLAEGGAAKVWLAVRTPPNIILRTGPGPLPSDVIGVTLMRVPARLGDAAARFGRRMDLGDLSTYGLPVPEEGVFSRMRRLGVAPAIVDKDTIEAIKDGRIEVVRGVASLDATGAILDDGARVEPDAIVCATGYRRGLEPLVGHLGVLTPEGRPVALAADAAAPGLRFVGFISRPAALGYMGKEARRAAKAIARELRGSPSKP